MYSYSNMFFKKVLRQFETAVESNKPNWEALVKQAILTETTAITGRVGSKHSISRTDAIVDWSVNARDELNRELMKFYAQTTKEILQEINDITSDTTYEKQDIRKLYELFIDGCREGIESIITNFPTDRGPYYTDREEINLSKLPTKFYQKMILKLN